MLSREDNELLCRVGPGTAMGFLLRQYWIPALVSSELPEHDGAPVRVRLLGENLIAFRVTSGKVGLIRNHCPHRGASLFFGRNEEEGIRCVYHGWKFDVTGRCVDMPSEPEDSTFQTKVCAVTYPCVERNGVVWTYMGARATRPPLPDIGTSYGAYRPAEADTYYWRIAHFLFPFFTMIPTGVLGTQILVRAWVPVDDDHTMFWSIGIPRTRGGAGAGNASLLTVNGRPV